MKRIVRMIVIAAVLVMALMLAVSIVGAADTARNAGPAVESARIFEWAPISGGGYIPHPPIKDPIIWPPPSKF